MSNVLYGDDLNLQAQELIVFRNPENGYYLVEVKGQEPIINPLDFPDVEIIISQIFT
ncbi:hypothetical protein H6G06_18140 [Anabaena sphaerica FACHB-251]|uniref:Uncharacterized protein n=1 Tax=Anabaena sphaerica FACHB-251 TaxID=2692883 RepID=A0A926WJP2_9NOST|nr:hypothetical protein [Anabaena sphaerica]MBD2295337.1 hypothetical protein [Anabaena sphaerica FACHB-251]